jgi:hypothetical protein
VVSGATLTDDRFGSPGGAYVFNGEDTITIEAPWNAGDEEFSVAVWIKPTAGSYDETWHGFVGYQEGGTRSPSLWVNAVNDYGFGIDDGGGDDPDGLAQSGLHWDTHTSQNGDGTRYNGVIDGIFALDTWVNVVWTHTPGGTDTFWKNGVNACAAKDSGCPDAAPHVDLHSHYCIGSSKPLSASDFVGVIDEVWMFDYAVANYEVEALAGMQSMHSTQVCTGCIEGFYSDQDDSEMCKACSVGFFSGATESTSCTRCGSGTYAPKAAAECSSCVGPYYDLDQTASTPCAPCPGESPAFCKCSSATHAN